MNEQSSNEFFHGSSFMQGQNAEYLENLRLNFKENQNSVDSAWQAFFQSLESNAGEPSENSVKPSWTRQDWPQQPNDELTTALMNEWNTDSEFAISIKNLVAEKLEDGNSEKEIYDYLKVRYGDWILYDPEFSKNTYFLWLLPLLLFVFGGAIIFKLFNLRKN